MGQAIGMLPDPSVVPDPIGCPSAHTLTVVFGSRATPSL
jgi:hypothetical protein